MGLQLLASLKALSLGMGTMVASFHSVGIWQHLMERLKSLLREDATLADVTLSIRVEMPSGPAAFLFLRPFKRVWTVSLEHCSLSEQNSDGLKEITSEGVRTAAEELKR